MVFTHGAEKNLIKNSKGQFAKEEEAKFPEEKEKEILREKRNRNGKLTMSTFTY